MMTFHASLIRDTVATVQINVGKRCNQACRHCHVEAGPKRTEQMTRKTAERIMNLVANTPSVTTVDITGGAPELNPQFRYLVTTSRQLGRAVIDRCNLTVLFEPNMSNVPDFLAANAVKIVASLPCYTSRNVDDQRGRGVFDKSIAALKWLNRLGYGRPDSELELDLVYNPLGPHLPPPQPTLEHEYRVALRRDFNVEFTRLLTMTNLPVKRFASDLHRLGKSDAYMQLLIDAYNPVAAEHVMCKSLINISHDGRLYDCDFNQMLELFQGGAPKNVWDIDTFESLLQQPITTSDHCYGCTAGAGSSCGGALA